MIQQAEAKPAIGAAVEEKSTAASSKFFGMSPLPFQEKFEILKTDYTPKVHRIGLIIAIVHVIIMFLPGLYLLVAYGVWPGWNVIMSGVFPIWAALAVVYVIEPVQYFLALGTVGTYVSFLAGNISNIRLPVAVTTTEVAGVEPGSPEAEVVSGISIITSQWVLVVVVLAAAVLVTWVVNILPPSITKAFDFLIPALFGGLLVNVGLSQWRYMVVAVVMGFVLTFLGVPSTFMTLIMVALMIALSAFFYKKGIWVPKEVQKAATED